jgi:hypothetical protein
MAPRIGIDFGGVIVRHQDPAQRNEGVVEPCEPEELAHEGLFERLPGIVSSCAGQVWIVSKAGPAVQRMTIDWLESVKFYSRTGLRPDHVRFCRLRQEKETICRELALSHFVDDRVHVMQILRYTVPHQYLFGGSGDERYCPPWATFVSSWEQLATVLAPHF